MHLNHQESSQNLIELGDKTYELCYNKACIEIGKQNYQEALKMLNVAEELCRKTLEEEGSTDEDIENELSIIRVQMGYAYQMLGKNDIASKLYNQVLKNK